MNTVSESFRNIGRGSTVGADLRSPVGIHPDKLSTSFFHFVGKLLKERTPRCIIDRTGEHTTRQTFDIQVFDGNKAILVGEHPAQFVLKIRPLMLNAGVRLLEKGDCFMSTNPTLFSTGDLTLDTPQVPQSHFEATRISDYLPIGQGGKRGQTNINTNNLTGGGSQSRIEDYTETGIPVTRVAFQRKCLNLTKNRAMHFDLDDAHTLNLEPPLISQVAAITPSREGVAVESITRLESRITRLLSGLNALKESDERLIEAMKNVLAGRKISQTQISRITDGFKLLRLVIVIQRDTLHSVSIAALLKRSVIERPGFIKLALKRGGLFFCGVESIEKRLAHLPSLLRFDVMLNCRRSYRANATDEIRTAPKGRQARTKFREFSTQHIRRVTLELSRDVSRCLSRVSLHKQMNVVGHYFQSVNLGFKFQGFSPQQFLQTYSYLLSQYGASVLRTPNQVILERENRTSVLSIFTATHTSIIQRVTL